MSSYGCLGCHGGAGGLTISGHSSLYGQLSSIGMNYVTANDLSNSYLWLKMNGTHVAAGGFGSQMPLSGQVSSDDLLKVQAWILGGALP